MRVMDLIQEMKKYHSRTETNIRAVKKIDGFIIFEVANGASSSKPKSGVQSKRGNA